MRDGFTAPTGAKATGPDKDTKDTIEKKLWDMLLELPITPKPAGSYLPTVRMGKFIHMSGQLPLKDGSLGANKGRLGKEIALDGGQRAALQCTLNALAHLKRELGSLDKVKRVIKLTGYVSGMPGFTQQSLVLNGASDFLIKLYGEAGKHSRSVVGVMDLPMGACVEIEYIFEIK